MIIVLVCLLLSSFFCLLLTMSKLYNFLRTKANFYDPTEPISEQQLQSTSTDIPELLVIGCDPRWKPTACLRDRTLASRLIGFFEKD